MYSVKKNKKSNTLRRRKKILVITLLVLLAAGAIFATYWFFFREDPGKIVTNPTSNTANSETKGEVGNVKVPDNKNGSADTTQPADNKSSTGGTTSPSAPLQDPYGSFVSNHRPNLGGSPAPNEMQSICNTTPGASCEIIFSKDGIIKKLPAQTTDKAGAAYWTWKLQAVGLTEGVWKVEAKATLNGQSKTAADPVALEVKS